MPSCGGPTGKTGRSTSRHSGGRTSARIPSPGRKRSIPPRVVPRSWLERVGQRKPEGYEGRVPSSAKMASQSSNNQDLRLELMACANLRCEVSLPTDALELLGE